MKLTLQKKQALTIAGILVVGALLAALVLRSNKAQPEGDEHGHDKHTEVNGNGAIDGIDAAASRQGPHGGKLFAKDGYSLEIRIFEQGVEPEFHVYAYQDGKPLDPSASRVGLTLERLGRAPEEFAFVRENDYLKSKAVVEEPHSFKVKLSAQHGGKAYQFGYEQIEARVTMTNAQIKQNGVELQTAGPARIRSELVLTGEIRLNQDHTVHIVPQLTGMVESVTANAGDKVRKGQLLAVISSQALADQRSAALAAQQRMALARTVFEREEKLWKEKISAEQDYQQARSALRESEIAAQSAQQKLAALGGAASAGARLTRYEIRSPIDGVVVDKDITVGAVLKEDSPIFVVADLSTVWVEMTVAAKDVNAVRAGQKANIKSSTFEASAPGTVSYMGALVGAQTRSAQARIVLPNPKGSWRPGLPVSVELVAQEFDVAIAVANEALQSLRDEPAVFGRYGNSFEARPVQLGRSDGKFTEIVKGLKAGEQYAAKNSFLIKADLGKAEASHDH
jgi:cobalt-zinc-cadmium efflux system membrane fusion protein